jgi:hypothetical protein
MTQENNKPYTVIRRTSQDISGGFTAGKLYAVETNEDYVILFDDGTITVWNDEGELSEMKEGDYIIVTCDETEWFNVKPDERYLEEA